MKLTKQTLRRVIKEELRNYLREASGGFKIEGVDWEYNDRMGIMNFSIYTSDRSFDVQLPHREIDADTIPAIAHSLARKRPGSSRAEMEAQLEQAEWDPPRPVDEGAGECDDTDSPDFDWEDTALVNRCFPTSG
jgi:hypothetical protein